MKRILLTIIMLISVTVLFFALGTSASAETYDDLTYEVSNGEVTITGCSNTATEVEIPAEIEGYPVVKIKAAAFQERYNLKSITIPESIRQIGGGAFGFTNIKKFNWNAIAVEDFDAGAKIFQNSAAEGMEIVFGDSVKRIPAYLFLGNWAVVSKITGISIGKSVTSIGEYAFGGCFSYLTEITIPESVVEIEHNAFGNGGRNYVLKDIYYEGNCEQWDFGFSPFKGVTVHIKNHSEKIIKGCNPTCTENGFTDGLKCSGCGESLVAQEEIPATGHTEEIIYGKPATCTATGLSEGKKCSVCGEILQYQEILPELMHILGDWVVVKAAQIGIDGKEERKCTVCGQVVYEKVIPALAPEYIPGDANGDCKVNAADARIVLRISAQLEKVEDYSQPFAAFDVTGDGKVNASDARKILRISAKLES